MTSNTAPAHPHATGVAVYSALFFSSSSDLSFYCPFFSHARLMIVYRKSVISSVHLLDHPHIYLSLHLSIRRYVRLPVNQSLHLFMCPLHLSICRCIYPPVHSSIPLFTHPHICSLVRSSTCQFVCPPTHSSFHLSVPSFISLTVCSSTLSFARPYITLSLHLCVPLLSIPRCIRPPVHSFIPSFIHLHICPSPHFSVRRSVHYSAHPDNQSQLTC